MTREQRIVETFVQMVDTMVDDFDVVDFLYRLVAHCVELLDCEEAGLLLADAAGALRVMASSSERADSLELLQSQNSEGPCYDCYLLGRVVAVENLRTNLDRWPMFAPAAVESGFLSVYSIPMRVRRETIGALNLLRSNVGPIPDSDRTLGQGLADIAAVALLQERALRESRSTVEQLQDALRPRVFWPSRRRSIWTPPSGSCGPTHGATTAGSVRSRAR
jgi:GAF domain-containing protein